MRHKNYLQLFIYCVCLTIIFYCNNLFAEIINVGGYHFPPFVEVKKDSVGGLTKLFIKEMNLFQKKYQFKFVLTSPTRRYYDFDHKEFDLIMFEDINWGWKHKDIIASDVYMEGGEVYITKADPKKDQHYFDSFKDKNIAIIKGFHYGFANFNANESYLRENFKVQFSSYHKGNILKVLFGRADISVVNLCYLKHFFLDNPDKKDQILVSDKLDQQYNHTILVRKKSSISIKEVNTLLTKMKNAKIMPCLWHNYLVETGDQQ
jgi:ABC-type amino acid transport substrate-binding protein